jgi:hypothetical protein
MSLNRKKLKVWALKCIVLSEHCIRLNTPVSHNKHLQSSFEHFVASQKKRYVNQLGVG